MKSELETVEERNCSCIKWFILVKRGNQIYYKKGRREIIIMGR